MKRILSVILCAAMLMLLPVQALAGEGDVIAMFVQSNKRSGGMESYCCVDDAMYFVQNNRDQATNRILGVHRAGETEAKRYPVQIGEALEDGYESIYLLGSDEGLYALRQIIAYEDDARNTRAELYRLAPDGDEYTATLVCEPDWSYFRTEDDYNYVENVCCAGGYALLSYYNDVGVYCCTRMSLADGSFADCSFFEEEIAALANYTDGRILAEVYADDSHEQVRFLSLDLESMESEVLGEAKIEAYEPFQGLACDPDSGAAYYSAGGEVFELNLQTGESGGAVTDMPVTIYSNSTSYVLRGGYYVAADYEYYTIRNLHPTQQPAARFKVYDNSYDSCVSRAFYAFSNEHGEVSTLLSRDYSDMETLVDDMMNRSGEVDVYIVDAGNADFEAVFQRGYVAELSGSEKLQAMAERMYPSLRDALSINGELCAVPESNYFLAIYLRQDTLEKLGLSVEDIPDNWSDFLDFLMVLPEKLPADGSVGLLEAWTDTASAKRSIFSKMFTSYQELLRRDPNAFSADQMVELLEKLDRVDFRALGQPTEEELENSTGEYDEDRDYLLEMNMGMSLSGISNENPMVMSLTADTPKMVFMSATLAFINPFSENRELALDFVEKLMENLSDDMTYTMFSDLTEPVENAYYFEYVDRMQDSIDALRTKYENAEEIDKQQLEYELSEAEQALKDYEQYRYQISEDDITWIHQNADALTIQGSNWLYGEDGDDVNAYVSQYCEGQIDAKKLMNEIDRKMRMMMLEGY